MQAGQQSGLPPQLRLDKGYYGGLEAGRRAKMTRRTMCGLALSPPAVEQKKRTEPSPLCRRLSACASVSDSMVRLGQDRRESMRAVLRQDKH